MPPHHLFHEHYPCHCLKTNLSTGLDNVIDNDPQANEGASETATRMRRRVLDDKVVNLLDHSLVFQLDIDIL